MNVLILIFILTQYYSNSNLSKIFGYNEIKINNTLIKINMNDSIELEQYIFDLNKEINKNKLNLAYLKNKLISNFIDKDEKKQTEINIEKIKNKIEKLFKEYNTLNNKYDNYTSNIRNNIIENNTKINNIDTYIENIDNSNDILSKLNNNYQLLLKQFLLNRNTDLENMLSNKIIKYKYTLDTDEKMFIIDNIEYILKNLQYYHIIDDNIISLYNYNIKYLDKIIFEFLNKKLWDLETIKNDTIIQYINNKVKSDFNINYCKINDDFIINYIEKLFNTMKENINNVCNKNVLNKIKNNVEPDELVRIIINHLNIHYIYNFNLEFNTPYWNNFIMLKVSNHLETFKESTSNLIESCTNETDFNNLVIPDNINKNIELKIKSTNKYAWLLPEWPFVSEDTFNLISNIYIDLGIFEFTIDQIKFNNIITYLYLKKIKLFSTLFEKYDINIEEYILNKKLIINEDEYAHPDEFIDALETKLYDWYIDNNGQKKEYLEYDKQWNKERINCLRYVYLERIKQNSVLKNMLLNTKNNLLKDTSDPKNINGIILMQVRWHLQNN
tara:strand:+ start:813 stop:2480 length:1668 start_codon:yes stop_codon:yes gene_type:complete